MFKFEGSARINDVKIRKEWHGEDLLPAVSIKLAIDAMKVKVVEDGLLPKFGCVFEESDPLLVDVKPISVVREIKNVNVSINGVMFEGMDIDGIKVSALAGKVADVDLVVKGLCDVDNTARLHDLLLLDVAVTFLQRQLELADAPE